MQDVTARRARATPKVRAVLMLDEGADRNLRVLAAMQRRTRSGLVEELIARAVTDAEGKAA